MPFDPSLSDRNIGALQDATGFAGQIKQQMQKAGQVLKPWKQKVIKWSQLYQMVQSNKHYQGLANIFVPQILRAVQTVVSNLSKITFSSTPWFTFVGRQPSDQKSAVAQTQLVNYQIEQNNFKVRCSDSFRQMAIAGLTVRKIGWDYQQIMTKQRVIGPDGIPATQLVPQTINDTWTFQGVDLISFLISDINTAYYDIRKAQWIGQEYYVDQFWVKQRMKRGWFSSLYKDQIFAVSTGGTDASNLLQRRNRNAGFTNANAKKKIHIFQRWGLVKASLVYSPEQMAEQGVQPQDLVQAVVIIANKQYPIKLEANPFWHRQKPYVSCPYVPQQFQFSGIGVAQIGEKLQQELNDTRNQTMDNKTLILNNMWLKEKGSGISNKSLRVRPLGVIQTNNINGLKPLQPPILTGVGVNIQGIVKEDLRQSTGASSNLQGIAQAGVGTATQSSIINKQSYSRMLAVAQMYGQLILKPTLLFAQSLNYQFYDHSKVIKVIGPAGVKFKQIAPKEIIGNKDIIIYLSTDLDDSPGVKRQQLIQFHTMILSIPPELLPFHWKMLDKIYQAFFPGKNLQDIYPAPPGQQELLNPMEQAQLAAAQYPVMPKPRQDIVEHIAALKQIFAQAAPGLSDKAFAIFKNLIMGYQKIQMQMAIQFEQQRAMSQQNQAKGGTKLNKGGIPNGNAFNQTARDTNAGLRKDIGA